MILNSVKPHAETSGFLDEKSFGTVDPGMIFEILRSKMYSNPILAICREISCNALDSHRESKKPNDPIVIHLPSGLEPNYKVKDFGTGISPDRIENIFIKYAASTKREDNSQIGGFGLGSKTPFSYVDSFTVITIYNNIKYHYVCYIDETKVGKLGLLNKTSTDEPNGTEISIPVKHADFNFFKQYTEQACRHWTVKPQITGGKIEWTQFKPTIEGSGWAIIADADGGHYSDYSAKLIIDGIEYPLELEALKKYADAKLIEAARGTFVMYFGIGELTLSANREQIYLDKPTQDKIKNRLDTITQEIKKLVEDKIESFPNLWDANVYYRKELASIFHNLGFLGTLKWHGHVLNNGYVSLGCRIYSFKRDTRYKNNAPATPNKLTRYLSKDLAFYENTQLYINDLAIDEPTPKHVKKAFENDANLQYVQVVCPNDKITIEVLNKQFHLDEMAPKRLSEITKAADRPYTPPTSRLLIFKFFGSGVFRQVSYDDMKADANSKVLCLLGRYHHPNDHRFAKLDNGTNLIGDDVLKLLLEKNPTFSFYGVDKETDLVRIKKEFSTFQKLEDFIDQKLLNNKSVDYVELRFAQLHSRDIDDTMLRYQDKLEPLILNKKSLFLSRLNLHKNLEQMNANNDSLLAMYQSIKGVITDDILANYLKKNPKMDIEKVNQEYDNKYPLLADINTYNYNTIVQHIAHYINLIDKN